MRRKTGPTSHVGMMMLSDLLKKNQRTPEEEEDMEEHAALSVLHRWGEMKEFITGALPLVPEHVEIRSLLNPEKPGLPQVATTQNYQTVTITQYHCWYCILSTVFVCRVTFICGWTCSLLMSQLHPLLTSCPAYLNSRSTHSRLHSSLRFCSML